MRPGHSVRASGSRVGPDVRRFVELERVPLHGPSRTRTGPRRFGRPARGGRRRPPAGAWPGRGRRRSAPADDAMPPVDPCGVSLANPPATSEQTGSLSLRRSGRTSASGHSGRSPITSRWGLGHGLDVLDEDQRAPHLGDVPECTDRCHGPSIPAQTSSRRMTGNRSSAAAITNPAGSQNAGVAALVASGGRPTSRIRLDRGEAPTGQVVARRRQRAAARGPRAGRWRSSRCR